MKINEVFSKDIFRPINGVVKADQHDDEIVWQELDEYVITGELDKHLHKFFSPYLSSIDSPHDSSITGRIGVWVSGFFGSGKSHFIKILSYLLANQDVLDPSSSSSKKAIAFFDDKIKDAMLLADIKRAAKFSTDAILFNIDSKADATNDRARLLSVFWRVFNERQGFSSQSLQLAEIERYLTKKNKYDEFRKLFKENYGSSWEEERDAYTLLQDEIVQALSKVLGKSIEAAEEWFNKNEKELTLTIDGFANRVKDYLDSKGPQHRLVFLVDEVGQFIGSDTHLMLNLQTITEDLGRICQGRAWVVVTSQEDIDAVLGDLVSSKANDFSKIQGRFHTRLSLSSSNTDEVIQARLLEKTASATKELQNLFQDKGDILRSQLCFSGDSATMKNYKNEDDFINNYPFSPYHFQLVQKIFESIRKAGVTGLHLAQGERSMLDAFQSAAKTISAKDVGALVPLYEFFPCIESFIDSSVKRSIDQAKENEGLDKSFDIQLLQTLFLIRYVQIIKPNIDNLVTLCIDEVDADRITIKKQIEESLQRLEKENLISSNGDLYYFLTNEEREVSKEIKHVEISSSDETKLIGDIVFEEILKGKTKHRYTPFKRDYSFNRICDSQMFGTRGECDLAVEIITPMSDQYSQFDDAKCVMHTSDNYGYALFRLADHKDFAREVRAYLQTDKYIRLKSDAAASPNLKEILRDRAEENRQRNMRIVSTMEDLIINADVFSLAGSKTVSAAKALSVIEDALDFMVQNIFTKFRYLQKLHDEPLKEIKATLTADDLYKQQLEVVVGQNETDDIKEVWTHVDLKISNNHAVVLSDLVAHFAKSPYGWPEFETVLLIARLFVGGRISLLIDSVKIQPREAIDPLSKSAQWKVIKINKRRVPDKGDLQKAQQLGKELFGTIGSETQDKLYQFLRKKVDEWKTDLNSYLPLADTGDYPGKNEIDSCLNIVNKLVSIYDSYEFIKLFNENKDDLLDAADDLHDLRDFYTNQISTWKELLRALVEFKPNQNILEKNEEASKNLSRLHEIRNAENPYGLLSEVNSLVIKISEINDLLIKNKQEVVTSEIDNKINQIKDILSQEKANSDLSNRSLIEIQTTKKKVSSETSIPNIDYYLNSAEEQLHDAIDLIEQETKAPDDKPAKEIKTIRPANINTKIYIETEDDVQDFISKIHDEISAAIKDNKRVRIE